MKMKTASDPETVAMAADLMARRARKPWRELSVGSSASAIIEQAANRGLEVIVNTVFALGPNDARVDWCIVAQIDGVSAAAREVRVALQRAARMWNNKHRPKRSRSRRS